MDKVIWRCITVSSLTCMLLAFSQAFQNRITAKLEFSRGLPQEISAFPLLLSPVASVDPRLKTHKVIAGAVYKTDRQSFGVFLCKGSSGLYLLIDSFGGRSAKPLNRYDPTNVSNGIVQFRSIDLQVFDGNLPHKSIFLAIAFDEAKRTLTATTDWCTKGKLTVSNRVYNIMLAKVGFPGYIFSLDYISDYLLIDRDGNGWFDLPEEGAPLRSTFRFGNLLYKPSYVDSIGQSITLTFAGTDSLTLDVGDRSPALTLKYLDGQLDTTIGRDGKVTLVDFWATWCTPCVAEIPELKALQGEFANKGFRIVGVSGETTRKDLETFVSQYTLPWPLAFSGDSNNMELLRLFSVYYYPKHIIIDHNGILRGIGIAPSVRGEGLRQLIADLVTARNAKR